LSLTTEAPNAGSTTNKTGLFNTLTLNAEVSDFTVEVSTPSALRMECETYFGGVVGFISGNSEQVGNIKIKNVTVSGNLRYGQMTDNGKFIIIGGLLGQIDITSGTVTIENCTSTLNILAELGNASHTATNKESVLASAGGLIGNLYFGDVTIKNSYATGNITITADAERSLRGGGLIGALSSENGTARDYKIQNCYASGIVTVSSGAGSLNASGGGLIGEAWWRAGGTGLASITNCAALGSTVLASGNAAFQGRVIGKTATYVTLSNNIANAAMEIGTSSDKRVVEGGQLDNINGLDKNLSTDHAGILAVLNQDLTVPAWEYKTGAALPSLK
jgi:hypothetical protein